MTGVKLLIWSRKLHKWIGVYVSVLTVIWLTEMAVLPAVFNPGLPVIPDAVPSRVGGEKRSLSFEQVQQIFMKHRPSGIDSVAQLDEISYLPKKGVYRFAVREGFLEWYVDAKSGEIIDYGFNENRFVMSKSMFGWLHPAIAGIIRAPFELLFVVLVLTGCHVVCYPWLKKSRRAGREG